MFFNPPTSVDSVRDEEEDRKNRISLVVKV